MLPHPERWLTGPRWRRQVSLIIWLVLLILAVNAWLSPTYQQRRELTEQYQQLSLHISRLRLQVVALPGDSAQRIAALEQALAPRPFSLPELLEQQEIRLVQWTPSGRRGEVLAELDWRQLPPLFAALSQASAMPVGFSLTPDKGRLTLKLQLELPDEI